MWKQVLEVKEENGYRITIYEDGTTVKDFIGFTQVEEGEGEETIDITTSEGEQPAE